MEHKVSLEIYGSLYPITTTEDPEYVLELGKQMDRSIQEIMDGNGSTATLPQALVLALLSAMDGWKKAEEKVHHLENQVEEYLEEAAMARKDLVDARIECERLRKDYQLKIEEP